MRVHLAIIPSADKALHDLGTFAFAALHLFSMSRRHLSAVAKLLRRIDRMEEIYSGVQGMISSPHLSMTLIYNVSWQCSQYLNRCVAASASEVLEVLGSSFPFSLESILVDLDGGRYVDPIFPTSLADLLADRRSAGSSSIRGGDGGDGDGGSSGNIKPKPKLGTTGGAARLRARYKARLTYLSFQYEENLWSILAVVVLPTLHGHVLCKNCHL